MYFITVKRVGGFIHAAALDGFRSRYIVQASMPQVGTPVMERSILFVLAENNQNPLRQVLPLEPDCPARLRQLRGLFQADGQFA